MKFIRDRKFIEINHEHKSKRINNRNTGTGKMFSIIMSICMSVLVMWRESEVTKVSAASFIGGQQSKNGLRNNNNWSYNTGSTTVVASTANRIDEPFTLSKMSGPVDPRKVERELLRLGRQGRLDQVCSLYQSLFEKLEQPVMGVQVRPTTKLMNVAIAACSSSVPTALDVFHHGTSRHISPNVYTYGALLKSCAISRNVTMALDLLQDMEHVHRIQPNAVIYSTIIKACEEQPQLAYQMLVRGALEGQMGVVGYNAAISAMAKNGQWKMALSLLYQMKQRNRNSDSKFNESLLKTPNLKKYNDQYSNNMTMSFLNMNSLKDDIQKNNNVVMPSVSLPTGIITPEPDQITYGTVMTACERCGQWEHVLTLAKEATNYDKKNSNSNILLDGRGLCSALHACQQLGFASDAIEYFQRLKTVSPQSQIKNRNRQTFFAKGPDAIAYRMIISACAKSKQHWSESIRFLNEMKRELGNADVQAYTCAIMGCAVAGEHNLAFQLLDEMQSQENNSIKPNVITFTAVITACATAASKMESIEDRKEPMRRALNLFESMQRGKNKVEPNIVTYNAAIRACAEGKDLNRAFQLMDELHSRRISPTIVTYGSLMTACERVSSIEGVNRVFRLMTAGTKSDSSETELQEHKTQTIRPNEIIFGAAISCCRKANEPDRALSLLRKMIKEYDLIPSTATFNTVLIALTEYSGQSQKYMDKAISLFKLMNSKTLLESKGQNASIDNDRQNIIVYEPNRQTYNILVGALASKKRPEDAEAFLSKMRKEGFIPDVDLYTTTVTAFERAGKPRMALQLMQSMQEDGYNFYEVKVLDDAFKKAVKLVNGVVGRKKSIAQDTSNKQ